MCNCIKFHKPSKGRRFPAIFYHFKLMGSFHFLVQHYNLFLFYYFFKRNIVLNVGVFDSKQCFLDGLRASFRGGMFLLGKVSGTDIGAYVSYQRTTMRNKSDRENSRRPSTSRFKREATGSFLLR